MYWNERMKALLILLLVVSCGKDSPGDNDTTSVTCSTDTSLIQVTWQDTFNNDVYNLSSCNINQDCAACNTSCGDSTKDFKINYNDNNVSLHKYFYGSTDLGTWEICGDTLTIKWNDGNESIFNKVVQ